MGFILVSEIEGQPLQIKIRNFENQLQIGSLFQHLQLIKREFMQVSQSQQKLMIDHCYRMIISQETIHQESFQEYLANAVTFGVSDAISDMICDHFYAALESKQDLFYYIQLIDCLIKMKFSLPFSILNIFKQVFQNFYLNQEALKIEKMMALLKQWNFYNSNLAYDLKVVFSEVVKENLANKFRMSSRKKSTRESSAETAFEMSEPRKMVKLQVLPETHTKKEENNKLYKARQILSKLNMSFNYACKECGQGFNVHENYQKHIEKHFLEKLAQFKEKKNSKRKEKESLPTAEAWTNEEEVIIQPCNEEIVIENIKHCVLCKEKLQIFMKDAWLYKDCIKVKAYQIPGQILSPPYNSSDLAHIQCYLYLKPHNN